MPALAFFPQVPYSFPDLQNIKEGASFSGLSLSVDLSLAQLQDILGDDTPKLLEEETKT